MSELQQQAYAATIREGLAEALLAGAKGARRGWSDAEILTDLLPAMEDFVQAIVRASAL
jgi:hypothetical protein